MNTLDDFQMRQLQEMLLRAQKTNPLYNNTLSGMLNPPNTSTLLEPPSMPALTDVQPTAFEPTISKIPAVTPIEPAVYPPPAAPTPIQATPETLSNMLAEDKPKESTVYVGYKPAAPRQFFPTGGESIGERLLEENKTSVPVVAAKTIGSVFGDIASGLLPTTEQKMESFINTGTKEWLRDKATGIPLGIKDIFYPPQEGVEKSKPDYQFKLSPFTKELAKSFGASTKMFQEAMEIKPSDGYEEVSFKKLLQGNLKPEEIEYWNVMAGKWAGKLAGYMSAAIAGNAAIKHVLPGTLAPKVLPFKFSERALWSLDTGIRLYTLHRGYESLSTEGTTREQVRQLFGPTPSAAALKAAYAYVNGLDTAFMSYANPMIAVPVGFVGLAYLNKKLGMSTPEAIENSMFAVMFNAFLGSGIPKDGVEAHRKVLAMIADDKPENIPTGYAVAAEIMIRKPPEMSVDDYMQRVTNDKSFLRRAAMEAGMPIKEAKKFADTDFAEINHYVKKTKNTIFNKLQDWLQSTTRQAALGQFSIIPGAPIIQSTDDSGKSLLSKRVLNTKVYFADAPSGSPSSKKIGDMTIEELRKGNFKTTNDAQNAIDRLIEMHDVESIPKPYRDFAADYPDEKINIITYTGSLSVMSQVAAKDFNPANLKHNQIAELQSPDQNVRQKFLQAMELSKPEVNADDVDVTIVNNDGVKTVPASKVNSDDLSSGDIVKVEGKNKGKTTAVEDSLKKKQSIEKAKKEANRQAQIKEMVQNAYNEGENLGIVDEVVRLTAQRLTVEQIVTQLGLQDKLSNPKLTIRSIKAKLGIPSTDSKTEFDNWVNEYNKKSQQAAEPAETVKPTIEAPKTDLEATNVELYNKIVKHVFDNNAASASSISNEFGIDISSANKILEEMRSAGIVGAARPDGTREIIADSVTPQKSYFKSVPTETVETAPKSAYKIEAEPIKGEKKRLKEQLEKQADIADKTTEKLPAVSNQTDEGPTVIPTPREMFNNASWKFKGKDIADLDINELREFRRKWNSMLPKELKTALKQLIESADKTNVGNVGPSALERIKTNPDYVIEGVSLDKATEAQLRKFKAVRGKELDKDERAALDTLIQRRRAEALKIAPEPEKPTVPPRQSLEAVHNIIEGKDTSSMTDAEYYDMLRRHAKGLTKEEKKLLSQLGADVERSSISEPKPEKPNILAGFKLQDGTDLDDATFKQLSQFINSSRFKALPKNKQEALRAKLSELAERPDVTDPNRVARTEDVLAESNKSLAEITKMTPQKAYDLFQLSMFDSNYSIKRKLKELGPIGDKVIRELVLSRGGSAYGTYLYDQLEKNVFGNILPEEYQRMSNVIWAMADKDRLTFREERLSADNATVADRDAYIENTLATFGSRRPFVEAKIKEYFDTMRIVPQVQHNSGMITEDKMREYMNRNYQPFIPLDEYEAQGLKPTSGYPVEIGTTGLPLTDAKTLAKQALTSGISYTYRNTAKHALGAILEGDNLPESMAKILLPDNVDSEGRPIVKTGYIRMKYKVNDEDHYFQVKKTFADEFNNFTADLQVSTAKMLQVFSVLSGAKLVKTVATGLNPEWAVKNVPKDLGYYWWTTKEWSPIGAVALAQMVSDGSSAINDFKTNGPLTRMFNEHGRMSFMSDVAEIGHNPNSFINRFIGTVSGIGNISETIPRLMLLSRALKNRGFNDFEEAYRLSNTNDDVRDAIFTVRNALDFSQGGTVSRMLSQLSPYFNTTMQATRGYSRALKPENLPATAVKVASTMATIGLIRAMLAYDDEFNEVIKSSRMSSRFYTFRVPGTRPFYNKKGQKCWHAFRIPKGPTTVIADYAIDKALGNETGTTEEALNDATKQLLGVDALAVGLPLPTLITRVLANQKSLLGGSGPIFYAPDGAEFPDKTEEWDPTTSTFAKFAGKAVGIASVGALKKTGFASPKRIEYALQQLFGSNGIAQAAKYLVDPILDEVYLKSGYGETVPEMIAQLPMLRTFYTVVNSSSSMNEQIDKAKGEYAQGSYVNNRAIQLALMQSKGMPDTTFYAEIAKITAGKPAQDIIAMTDKAILDRLEDVPYSDFMKSIQRIPSPAGQARVYRLKYSLLSDKAKVELRDAAIKVKMPKDFWAELSNPGVMKEIRR